MKLIVGLGNPGNIYARSRHNIGFMVVKALAKDKKAALKKESGVSALSARLKIAGQDIILAVPLTFMNLSGPAVKGLLVKYKVNFDDLLVVCDDLDLEFGRFKIRPAGTSGGHRGLESIINSLGTKEFSRLRIGIGRPRVPIDAADYVLSVFTGKEREEVGQIVEKAIDCVSSWINFGMNKAMDIFNRRQN